MEEASLYNMIQGCLRNSPVHQKQLYQYCFTSMMKVCLRYCKNTDDAAACYNEAMRKVFQNIAQCRNEAAFMGWVKQIVVNTSINDLKSRARFEKRHLTQGDETAVFDLSAQPATDITAAEILQFVQQLPPTHSLVFNLYAIEGYTHEEISQQLSIAVGTSKWYLSEARQKLKKNLNNVKHNETITYR